eukprot:2545498-Pyramimonas_sp.AAC.1
MGNREGVLVEKNVEHGAPSHLCSQTPPPSPCPPKSSSPPPPPPGHQYLKHQPPGEGPGVLV